MTREIAPVLAQDLEHSFGSRAVLDGVSFELEAGGAAAITGPSGSGKSTLLACLLGLVAPTRGQVYLMGVELAPLSRRGRAALRAEHVGVVFQRGELVPALTAEENVAIPARLRQRHRRHRSAAKTAESVSTRARALLADLGVPAGTTARDLSGGEVQRTALARALVNSPQIVLADEPTGALDADLRDASADLLFDECRRRGAALLVVTHDPSVAARAARVLHLDGGHLTDATSART